MRDYKPTSLALNEDAMQDIAVIEAHLSSQGFIPGRSGTVRYAVKRVADELRGNVAGLRRRKPATAHC